tara:strand:+ start:386 stop:622 length:237 start_codon:yes stop_codon:yes gene_type:complete
MPQENQFEKRVNKVLREQMTSGGADGAFGETDAIFDPDNNQTFSGDYYAPGDARVPKVLGKTQSRNGEVGKKKNKKKQ